MDSRYYIGYSADHDTRFMASSGGVGSTIIRYLMEQKGYGTSMTFVFNSSKHMYEPRLIHAYSDYNMCGSVYQDTDTIGFIRENIPNIKDGIVVTCMPCQVRIIRHILDSQNIRNFIISFCCSGQTTVQGTWLYYKFIGVRKEDVSDIKYRGNGWPSGIQITLKNGGGIFRKNWTYPWTLIHQSLLFRPKRCLRCRKKTDSACDVTLADPWLKEYEKNDKTGNTLVIANTPAGCQCLKDMEELGLLIMKKSNEEQYIMSQKGTIEKKAKSQKHNKLYNVIAALSGERGVYKRIVISSAIMMKLHNRILGIGYKFF